MRNKISAMEAENLLPQPLLANTFNYEISIIKARN